MGKINKRLHCQPTRPEKQIFLFHALSKNEIAKRAEFYHG